MPSTKILINLVTVQLKLLVIFISVIFGTVNHISKDKMIENHIQKMLQKKNPIQVSDPHYISVSTITNSNSDNNHNHSNDKRLKAHNIVQEDDLYKAFRNFLIVGRLLGLCPYQGVFKSSDCRVLKFGWKSWPTTYNVSLTILLIFSAIANLIACMATSSNGYNASDLAWSANMAVYYSIGAYNYQYFLRNGSKLFQLFKSWQDVKLCFGKRDKNLYRDVNLISGLIYITCVLEHAYSHLKFFPLVDIAERRLLNDENVKIRLVNASAFNNYYIRSHPFLDEVIPYSLPVGIFFFIISKFSIFAWDFGDIMISIMSRSLYYKFKMLNEEAERILFSNRENEHDREKWSNLMTDHAKLCRLVLQFEEVLSPLIFASFGVNIYYLCLQLNLGLTPSLNNSTIATVYAVWSFCLIILRLLAASIPAAEIHVHAHKIVHLLKKCPLTCYTLEVERTERYLIINKIGLSGLSCFVITRPFILQLISVVLTFEIVLLQSATT